MRSWRWFLLMFLTAAAPSLLAAEATPGANSPVRKAVTASFDGQIKPVLAKYCVGCHGGAKPKADLNLETIGGVSFAQNRKAWEQVLDYVEGGDMPPPGKPKPSPAETELLTGWLDTQLNTTDCGKTSDPGQVTIRRLNRVEYNNTIRDLVGVDFQPCRRFSFGRRRLRVRQHRRRADAPADPDGEVPRRRREDRRVGDRRRAFGPGTAQDLGGRGTRRRRRRRANTTTSGACSRRTARSSSSTISRGTATYILRACAFGQQAGTGAGADGASRSTARRSRRST